LRRKTSVAASTIAFRRSSNFLPRRLLGSVGATSPFSAGVTNG
jgi:hypothetical protein